MCPNRLRKFPQASDKMKYHLSCRRLVLLFLAWVASSTNCFADEALEAIIQNVRSNEKLYNNLELVLERTYTLHEAVRAKSPEGFLDDLIERETGTQRLVRQKGLLFFSIDKQMVGVLGQTILRTTRQGYDGESTRTVTDKSTASVFDYRFEDGRLPRAHTLILEKARIPFSLSRYLTADENRKTKLQVDYVGVEEVDGLECLKLRCHTWRTSKEKDVRYIWLARERNYIPARTEFYVPRWTSEIAYEVGSVTEWKEIDSGVWFPSYAVIDVVFEVGLQAKIKEAIPYNTTRLSLAKALPNPQHDISLFRNISIPAGVEVNVVRDGKIVDTYVQPTSDN